MSSKLLIEQMTEQVETEVEKTAEEAEFEKVASVYNVVEQAQILTSVGEEMYKIASEIESEPLAALAADTYTLGERMGSCLSKTASEDNSALEEALEIAGDMHKVASVYAEIADEIKDEDLNKLAEAVINISNEMVEEANEVMGQLEKEAGTADRATKAWDAIKGFATKAAHKTHNAAGHPIDYVKSVSRFKELINHPAVREGGKEVGSVRAALRMIKANPTDAVKNLGPSTVGAAAALAAAGYGVKKATEKK